jgi:hypothetical protein
MEPVAVFKPIHRIGRVMLYETAISLQLTDFRTGMGLEQVAGKINTILLLTEDYTAKQEEYVFSAIAEYEPSVMDAFRQKHAVLRKAAEELSIAVQETTGALEPQQRAEAGRQLEALYTHFLRSQLKLMGEKERVLQPILERYYTQDFLRALQQELMQHDDCQLCLLQANWIIKTLEEEDLIAWLKTVEKKASPECMQLLLAAAEEQMEGQRFDKLTEALTEGVLLA